MADLASGTKKHKDAQTLALLRDTCHLSKSLVDWYRKNQEENTQIPEGFSSCASRKTHQGFYNFSPRLHRHERKKVGRLKTDNKRNSGLACFTGEVERLKEDIENLVQENKQKTPNQNNAGVYTSTGVSFTNNGKSVKFKFKHFADPEDLLSEYINAHIYNRNRLERVDKKRVFASVISLHNRNKETSTDLNDEAKPSKSLHALRTSEITIHCNKRSTDIFKLERRFPRLRFVEKAMATKNFVFELGALDAINKQNGRRDFEPALGVGPALSSRKDKNRTNARLTEDNKKVLRFHRVPTSISLLPKLNPNELRTGNTDAKSFDGRKTVLPNIARGKNLSRKNKELCRKPSPDFDIKVADVKSNWQLLKQRRNCSRITDSTTKLFDTLEKMSTKNEIHKLKNPSLNRGAHAYGIRNYENPDEITAAFFPEKKYSETENTTSLKDPNDGTKFKKMTKRSTHKGKMGNCQMNTANAVLKNKTLPVSKRSENRRLESKVEKYLDKYSLAWEEKMLSNNQEKEVSHPSPEVVANMLAKLNIFDVGFHIGKEKKKESVNVVTSPKKLEIGAKTKSTSWDTLVKQNNEQREKLGTVEKTSGANQTEKIGIRKNNAFVEMGLNGLESHLSKDLCSQILKSDFLKKDLSFKPARFFGTSLNFNNSLNSCRKLTLNVDNHRSDSSPCNKWLQKKIRRIMASSVCEDSKDVAEKSRKIVERLKKNGDNDLKKLKKIVDTRLNERKGKKKTFAQKFLEVHTDILQNPRLQAILPRLIDGIPNFAKKPSR